MPVNAPSIFLSHSHSDKCFATKIAADLREAGAEVWIDEAEIKLGDSLIDKISEAIDSVDYLAALLSAKSVESEWVRLKEALSAGCAVDDLREAALSADNIDDFEQTMHFLIAHGNKSR